MDSFEDVLRFWFPAETLADPTKVPGQLQWWFGGGADEEVIRRGPPLLARAIRGELDGWADRPRSRLALIIVLDQFSRSVFRETARAFAQDAKAVALACEGIELGHYDALASPWEKTFLLVPLSHSEDLDNHERSVRLTARLATEAPPALREILEFSAGQARGHRDVIARFGRHPHRNAVLGRQSTPEEVAYVASGQLVHKRSFGSTE
jgi:uncharacterized protein (DUF924 family)